MGVSRRGFLRSTAGFAALLASRAAGQGADVPAEAGAPGPVFARERRGDMTYRRLGRTNLMISEVALGGSPQPDEPLFRQAIDRGINYIDASPAYGKGNCERVIGQVTQGIRDRFLITTKIHPDIYPTAAEMIGQVEDSLQRLSTDYVDILQIHGAGSAEMLDREEVLSAFDTLRGQGKIRFTGLTCHADPVTVCGHAIDSGHYDVITVAYNAYAAERQGSVYDDFLSECGIAGLIGRAVEHDVGAIAMKSQAGGDLQNLAPFSAEGVSLAQAKLRWVLSNPSLTAVITEIVTEQQLDEDLAVVGTPPSDAEQAALGCHVAATWSSVCRMCGLCSQACPQGVAVADILRYERYYTGYGRPSEARVAYAALPESKRGSACSGCGTCEQVCRYGLRVRERVAQAHRTLVTASA